ncbi:MAG: putative Holliday junction resolvase [Hyphomicrobiaceae bacterium]|jgi:putative Holliday junction resolvase
MTDAEPPSSGQTYEDATLFVPLLAPGSRLLGLDLGTKTIGLALSDVNRTVASSMETIRRKKFSIDVLRLLAIADEHRISGFVLGLPVNMDASEGPRAQATRSFARNLNQRSDLPILLWDERMTTQAATRLLIEADSSRKRRAQVVDKMAATLILQGALDRMRH